MTPATADGECDPSSFYLDTMNTAPCGRTRLRYGHRFVARLLLLISVAAGIKAVDDVQHRHFWLWFMLGCGVLALVGATELGLTDDGYELKRAFGLWHRWLPARGARRLGKG